MPALLLETKSVRKAFAGVEALKGVSFDLHAGEVHALIGENGAGKSTLIKIITGARQQDEGHLMVSGEPVPRNSPAIARALGIAAIYQQPSLFPHLSVAENIALTLETGGAWRRVDWKQRRRRAAELLERAGPNIDPNRIVSSLSMPEQQIVEIAKVVGSEAKILIMDEPTASLTEREVESLFRLIRTLLAQRVGIIYISHRLEEISAIANRVTVLRDGQVVATCAAGEVNRAKLIEMMVGRPLTAVFPKRPIALGEIALELHEICCEAAGIRNVSMSVRRGEIIGLAGLVGSGRTQLAETIFGLTPADSGEIRLQGAAVRISSPRTAIEQGIGYVPEDRRQHGVVLEMPVYANTSLASLDRVSRFGWLRYGEEASLAESYIGKLRIKTASPRLEAAALSGGNQQKLALARWLAIGPKVLILDEPTQGVDIASKSEIHSLMMDLAEQGMAIMMISSEMSEIIGMSDRVAVMRGGALAGILSRDEATQQKILSLALGQTLPNPSEMVR